MGAFGLADNVAYPVPMGGRVPDHDMEALRDDDAADVARFIGGDEGAFEALVARYESEVYRVGLRMLSQHEDALEATQEVFLRAYRGIPHFRGDATFRTWLVGIAINVCRNHATSATHRMRNLEVPLEGRPDPDGDPVEFPAHASGPNPESALYGKELGKALDGALAGLSGEHREVLVLRESLCMEYEEIAATIGCAVGTVKSRLARARDALRIGLKGVWP
jgi:RNA polymerase sigma-70 factor (ECF subfamily)